MQVGEIDLFLDVWVLGTDHLQVSVIDLKPARPQARESQTVTVTGHF